MRRRVESIYSKRSEEPKTACQRKLTAPLALSSTDRRDLQPRAHLRSPRRPRPCHPRPQQGRNSYSTQLRLTGSARWRYTSAHKKGGLKILSIKNPIRRSIKTAGSGLKIDIVGVSADWGSYRVHVYK